MAGTKSGCMRCGLTFGSVSAFDAHRTGEFERYGKRGKLVQKRTRRCKNPLEMLADGMVQNEKGWWTNAPMPEEAKAAFHKSPARVVERSQHQGTLEEAS